MSTVVMTNPHVVQIVCRLKELRLADGVTSQIRITMLGGKPTTVKYLMNAGRSVGLAYEVEVPPTEAMLDQLYLDSISLTEIVKDKNLRKQFMAKYPTSADIGGIVIDEPGLGFDQ